MTFQGIPEHERPTLHEEPLLEDKLEAGKEPFVPTDEASPSDYATAEQIKDASNDAAEKGFASMEEIDKVREDIARMHEEKIKQVTGGLSEKGFATPEQLAAVGAIVDDAVTSSIEGRGREDARIAGEKAQAKLDAQENPKKGLGAMMRNLLGLGARKRQDSQDRFNRVN